jgi:hypothetical protein
MTDFAAIPTIYKGIQFRSRLEARWAAFFDLVIAPEGREATMRPFIRDWKYEGVDLQGWIPDFILEKDDGPVLVEIKPAMTVDDLWQFVGKVEGSLTRSGYFDHHWRSALADESPSEQAGALISLVVQPRVLLLGSSPFFGDLSRTWHRAVARTAAGWVEHTWSIPTEGAWERAQNMTQYKAPGK